MRPSRLLSSQARSFDESKIARSPLNWMHAAVLPMVKDYAHHLREDPTWGERAHAFSVRVRDFSEALAPAALRVRQKVGRRAVYQDACHLLHAQRISRQPRDLLRQVPGMEIVEIEEAGLCCGSAGVYNVTNPIESRQLQQRKLENVLARMSAPTGRQSPVASGLWPTKIQRLNSENVRPTR